MESFFSLPLNGSDLEKEEFEAVLPSGSVVGNAGVENVNDEAAVASAPTSTAALFCRVCGQDFADRSEQVAHFNKSRVHRVNVKLRLAGMKPLSPAELAEMTGDDAEDASSSSSDDDEAGKNGSQIDDDAGEEGGAGPGFDDLVGKIREGRCDGDDGGDDDDDNEKTCGKTAAARARNANQPRIVYRSRLLKVQYTLWMALLGDAAAVRERPLPALARALRERDAAQLFVCAVSGGRFAAAVFRRQQCVAHITFSGYTVRKKQGGAQSAKDNQSATSQPRSIGATIRRKEEARFRQKVAGLLESWADMLSQCQVLFLQCPSRNRSLLVQSATKKAGAGSAPPSSLFTAKDPRLRSIPFPVGRPSFANVLVAHKRLTSVLVQPYDASKEGREDARPAATVAAAGSNVDEETRAGESGPVEEDEAAKLAREHTELERLLRQASDDEQPTAWDEQPLRAWIREHLAPAPDQFARLRAGLNPLVPAIDQGNDDALQLLLEAGSAVTAAAPADQNGEVVDDFLFALLHGVSSAECRSPLHAAAARAAHDGGALFLRLLELGSDPAQKDTRDRLPFDLVKDPAARRAVRLHAGRHPDAADWPAARVDPLTDTDVAEQQERARQKRARNKRNRKAKQQAEQAARAEQDELRRVEEEQALRAATLSDREKRALAAERRMGGSAGGGAQCAFCKTILPLIPFSRLSYKYCSVSCVQKHKKSLGE